MLNKLFDKIFSHPDLMIRPPVLLDIGASGALNSNWQDIAKYSICLAFDPDEREMDFISEKASAFKRLIVVNKIVTDHNQDETSFYLTSSPFCSSSLKPDEATLADWYFAGLFKTEKEMMLPSTSLSNALKGQNIDRVDWFKSDSQGVDLRLFKNLGPIQSSVIVADFEPGFIDAYKGEDKIKDLLGYMDEMPFWLCNFNVGKNLRMRRPKVASYFSEYEMERIKFASTEAAIFAEATYVNDYKRQEMKNERDYLLGCVFAIILKQYGFAAEIALDGKQLTGHTLFDDILSFIKQVSARPTLLALLKSPRMLKQKIAIRLINRLQKQL